MTNAITCIIREQRRFCGSQLYVYAVAEILEQRAFQAHVAFVCGDLSVRMR